MAPFPYRSVSELARLYHRDELMSIGYIWDTIWEKWCKFGITRGLRRAETGAAGPLRGMQSSCQLPSKRVVRYFSTNVLIFKQGLGRNGREDIGSGSVVGRKGREVRAQAEEGDATVSTGQADAVIGQASGALSVVCVCLRIERQYNGFLAGTFCAGVEASWRQRVPAASLLTT